jgi:hypothetical protein
VKKHNVVTVIGVAISTYFAAICAISVWSDAERRGWYFVDQLGASSLNVLLIMFTGLSFTMAARSALEPTQSGSERSDEEDKS